LSDQEKKRIKWGCRQRWIVFGNQTGKACVAREKSKEASGWKQGPKACHFLLTKSAALDMVL